jgi:hypothetical protein
LLVAADWSLMRTEHDTVDHDTADRTDRGCHARRGARGDFEADPHGP